MFGGDSISGNNGLFYVHSDHLGPVTLLTGTDQNEKSGTRACYYPFGAYRTTATEINEPK